MIRVFIGYDKNETVAYHVLAHSILNRASKPVAITPLTLGYLKDRTRAKATFWRERDENQSTDFSYTRFLVPYLCNYQGRAIFMDCDMLCRSDVAELWDVVDENKAVSVVKHEYVPNTQKKFLGQIQTIYAKKNWSSVMVFNNELCRNLTPGRVSEASGMHLHQFKWLSDDSLIGDLDPAWNHLVGEYIENPAAKLVHFTQGGPWFRAYQNCEFSHEWFEEFEDHCSCAEQMWTVSRHE